MSSVWGSRYFSALQRVSAFISLLSTAGDLFSRRWADTGRIMAAQLSVLFTFPTTVALLWWLPIDPPGGIASVKVLYGGFLFFMGSTISWCARWRMSQS